MVRPARPLTKPRNFGRHRHRTWMRSMTLATAGWCVWWLLLLVRRVAPGVAPEVEVAAWLGGAFAVPGVLLALLTIRSKASWLLFTSVALFANGSLLALPWMVEP